MGLDIPTIRALINANVTNYPNQAFLNNMMRTILLGLCDNSAGGGSGSTGGLWVRTGANFTNATDLPITALAGVTNLIVRLETGPAYWKQGVDYSLLGGGGIHVLVAGWNATTTNVNDVISIQVSN